MMTLALVLDHEYTGYYNNGIGDLAKAGVMAFVAAAVSMVAVGSRRAWRTPLLGFTLGLAGVWLLMSSQWEGGRLNYSYLIIALALIGPAMLLWGRVLDRPGLQRAAAIVAWLVPMGLAVAMVLGVVAAYDGGDLLYDTLTTFALWCSVACAWIGGNRSIPTA